MPQPTATIVDALSGDEVCPLCFDRFSAADACNCVVCRVSSCPSCAEMLDADGAARCFACRPPAQVPALAARSGAVLSLPRPVATKQAARSYTPGIGAARLPALPFPLTTSPRGVRALQRKPPGSVFIGLPTLSAQLSASLRASALQPALQQPRLAGRPLQKLLLLTQVINTMSALIVLCQRALSEERRAALRARCTTWVRVLGRHVEVGLHALTQAANELVHKLAEHAEPRLRALGVRMTRAKPGVVDPSRPIS